MTPSNFKTYEFRVEDVDNPRFSAMAAEWEISSEFWSVSSCARTIKSTPDFLAARVSSQSDTGGPWIGWYLATRSGADCELLFIFAAKSYRGLGVGHILMRDLLEKARALGTLETIFLEVRPSNAAAIKLYESYGFKLLSNRPRYYSNGEDALVYSLKLKS